MKRNLHKIFFVIFVVLISSCSKPNPIELEQNSTGDDDSFSLEIVSTDPSLFDYQNGYDSTGIANPLPKASSEFIITLLHNSGEGGQGFGHRMGNAAAYFYDKQQPIYNAGNNRIVGYRTKDLGDVKFNNSIANKVPHLIRFRRGSSFIDSLAGVFYHLMLRQSTNLGERINISLSKDNNSIFETSIEIPEEISGRIEKVLDGNILKGLNFAWNGLGRGKIDIIIGGFIAGNSGPYSLVRIKVADDGKFLLPKNILDQVPYQNFESVVFSFIRKIEKTESSNSLSDNYIAAQSIHNIRINLKN